MSINFTVEKLDKRHKGAGLFSHRIKLQGPYKELLPNYLTVREWCWSVWNPSCEREMILSLLFRVPKEQHDTVVPKHWCWHYESDYNECYIYLFTEQDLSMFLLKWK